MVEINVYLQRDAAKATKKAGTYGSPVASHADSSSAGISHGITSAFLCTRSNLPIAYQWGKISEYTVVLS